MNRSFSLLSVVLLYCSTISAQLIKIDYNNPLWSFDYMREAWKTIWIFGKQNIESKLTAPM